MLDTSSDAPCVSRIAKEGKKSSVNLSTDISHLKMFMVIFKMWFVKVKSSDVLYVQNEGGAAA